MTEPNLKKLTTQIKFADAQAEFVHEARLKLEPQMSATAFAELATLQAAASVLGRPTPERTTPKGNPVGLAGSRIPEAKALDLSTHEYKRRVKIVQLAGQELTRENILRVPAAAPRVKKAKAAAA